SGFKSQPGCVRSGVRRFCRKRPCRAIWSAQSSCCALSATYLAAVADPVKFLPASAKPAISGDSASSTTASTAATPAPSAERRRATSAERGAVAAVLPAASAGSTDRSGCGARNRLIRLQRLSRLDVEPACRPPRRSCPLERERRPHERERGGAHRQARVAHPLAQLLGELERPARRRRHSLDPQAGPLEQRDDLAPPGAVPHLALPGSP